MNDEIAFGVRVAMIILAIAVAANLETILSTFGGCR